LSEFYNPQRKRNMYDPASAKPFKLSRSKIDLFLNCPRCFYLDRRLGVGRPPGFPFNLNSAVDTLLKSEFDQYRKRKECHPMVKQHGIDAIPFEHEHLDKWRDSLHHGIQHHHVETNLVITGGVDDVWITSAGELVIVDYKATSKAGQVSIDADWQIAYKRQMSLYSWLFKKNGFQVSPTGYFVYCNGKAHLDKFNYRLEFDVSVLPYQTDDSWVEPTIHAAFVCLRAEHVPVSTKDCDYCGYLNAVNAHLKL